MTKAELLKEWQKTAEKEIPGGLALEKHGILLETLCDVIAAELLGGGEIPLPGIGKLKTKRTAPRAGRNPRTGEPVDVPAGMRTRFVPGATLKAALKGGA